MAGPQESKVVMVNVASLSWLQAITYLVPVIVLPYLFRVIGPERFGLIAFAQASIQYFMIVTDYSFNVSATKEISLCRHEEAEVQHIFSCVMTAKIVFALLSLLLLGMMIYFIPKFKNDWPVYILSFGVVLGNVLFPVWFFQGQERMKYIANLNVVGQFAYAFCIFWFIKGPWDYLLVPLITSFISVATGLVSQYIVFKKFNIRLRLQSWRRIYPHLKAGWDIFISFVAINAYTATRIFAVGLLTNNTTTGLYSIAERIANAVQTFPLSSFSQAIFPRLSKIFHKNKMMALQLMQQIQSITVNISLICIPIVFVLAPWIVSLVCGRDYPASVLSLRLLLLAVFFISSNAFRVQFLLVCGRTDLYSKIHVTMALIGLPLIFLLISSFSYPGAALATVFIEGGVFTITFFTVRKMRFF